MARGRSSDVTTGLIMITIGLIFLGERLAVVPPLDVARLWPLLLVVIGVVRMAAPRHAVPDPVTGRVSLACRLRAGFWLIFVGVFFLLDNYHVLAIDQLWPLFIVAGGVWMLIGRRHAKLPPAGTPGTDAR
jgi:LiaF transmembrane domain